MRALYMFSISYQYHRLHLLKENTFNQLLTYYFNEYLIRMGLFGLQNYHFLKELFYLFHFQLFNLVFFFGTPIIQLKSFFH